MLGLGWTSGLRFVVSIIGFLYLNHYTKVLICKEVTDSKFFHISKT
jgi:hypothetical protein